MKIQRAEVGSVSVLRPVCDLDESALDDLRAALFDCISEGRYCIVMNLSEVRYMSFMSLGVLVERLRRVRESHGDIKLVGLNLYGERMLRMAGVGNLFETFDSEARAIGMFHEAA